MDNKEFVKKFKNKEELLAFGQENLINEFNKIINDIDDKYIIRTHGYELSDIFCKLFNFTNNNEILQLEGKSISEFKKYIPIITENIFKSLSNKDSFISQCFHPYYNYEARDLEIGFELTNWLELDFKIMSLIKNDGSGSGDSFSLDLVNSEKLDKLINEVKALDIPESVKNAYIEYFNTESEDYLSIEQAKEYLIDTIKQEIDDYMYNNQRDLKTYKTLKRLQFDKKLKEYMRNDSCIGNISNSITLEYYTYKASSYDSIMKDCKEGDMITDENILIIKFLGEKIKEISKNEHTVYEINY